MSLLKITTTPIKITVTVDRPRFEEKQPMPAQRRVQKAAPQAKFQPIAPKIGGTSRASSDTVVKNQIRGFIPIQINTIGADPMMIHSDQQVEGVDVSSVIQEKVTNLDSNQVAYIPNANEMTWEPSSQMNLQVEPLQIDLNLSELASMEFVPGGINYKIEQYPSIQIEYTGEPIYVPASANPNYSPKTDAKKE